MSVSAPLTRLAPQTGVAFTVREGEVLRVVDPLGEQVADLVAFSMLDHGEWLSSGRTLDYASSIYLSTNDVLYANTSRPLLTILEDSVGRHDFLLTPCSQKTFEIIYGCREPHPSCLENLTAALKVYGIAESAIGTSFNIFMNVTVGPDGRLSVLPPRSRAGDYIRMRAEADLIVGLTACAAELSNNYALGPIDFAIERP